MSQPLADPNDSIGRLCIKHVEAPTVQEVQEKRALPALTKEERATTEEATGRYQHFKRSLVNKTASPLKTYLERQMPEQHKANKNEPTTNLPNKEEA